MSHPKLPTPFARPRRRAIGFVIGLGVLQGICLLAAVYATRGLFAGLHDGGPLDWSMVGLLAAAGLCVPVLQALARVRAEGLAQSYAIDLREITLDAIARLPADQRAKRSLGGLSLRFVGDMTAARGWVGLGMTRLVSGAILLPLAAVALWWLHPTLAVAGFGPLVVALVSVLILGRALHPRQKRLRKGRANIAIHAINRLQIAGDLRRFGRMRREQRDLRKRGRLVQRNAVARIKRLALLRALPEGALGLGGVLILLQAYQASIPASSAAAALAVLAIIGLPFKQMMGVWDKYAAWTVARGRYAALLAQADWHPNAKQTRHPADLTLIHRTETYAFAPGSEVSTADLHVDAQAEVFAACHAPSPGGTWQMYPGMVAGRTPRVAFVTDDPVILKGSLRRVLTLGCRKRPEDDALLATCARLGLTDVVDRLGGLDGRLGETGRDLRPSEKLRVALCQAISAAPGLVVVHSLVWPHLPDAAELARVLRKERATLLHNLPADIAPDATRLAATKHTEVRLCA